MNDSYQLKDGVLFVSGASRGALLDTISGGVYSINEEGCSVLRYEAEDDPYWDTLVSMALAERTTNVRTQKLPRLKDTNRLSYLWLEVVTDDCNERCAHCYADSMPKTYRRLLLLKPDLPMMGDEASAAGETPKPRPRRRSHA